MPRTVSDKKLVAWRTLLTVHAELTERIDIALREAGAIPLRWYDALLCVYEAPQRRIRLGELARVALLSRSGLSRLVDRLEVTGLLRREACDDDARCAYAVLTDAGLDALRMAWRIYGREIDRLFGRHLNPEEAERLTRNLRCMLDAVERDW
jgi:DNA-binding MarR family transcriptional regulator